MKRKTTLSVCDGNEERALEIATTFRNEWKGHHRRNNLEAELYGVIFTDRSPRAKFYAWGWDGHVRVVEQEIEP